MTATPPGWYPDVRMPNTQRFWDGDAWTDSVAPLTPSTMSAWKGVRIVAVGILAAVAAIWFVVQLSQPSELDCATQRAEVALGERSVYSVDGACR